MARMTSDQAQHKLLCRQRTIARALCITITLALFGCERGGSAAPPTTRAVATQPPLAVTTGLVETPEVPLTVDVTGTLIGEDESSIAAKVAGRIIEIRADLGDRVEGGSVLAQIDPTDYQLEVSRRDMALRETLTRLGLESLPDTGFDTSTVPTVQRAKVQAENAKARLDRARQLFTQNPPLISAQDFADIETQHEVARRDFDVAVLEAKSTLALANTRAAELAVARQQLADTEVRAPRDSSSTGARTWAVAQRFVSIGELVQPGSPMFRLIVDRPVKLRASVPERFLGRIAMDQTVSVHVESGGARAIGRVTRISPAVDPQSRTFTIEATFDNTDGSLTPGAFARGQVTIGKLEGVIAVPPNAVYSFAGVERIFTMENGKAVAHSVRSVQRDGQRVIVRANLPAGTQVITSDLDKLTNGTAVTPRSEPSQTPAAR